MSFWGKVGAIAVGVGGSFIPGVGPAVALPAAAALWTGDSAADTSKQVAAAQDKAGAEAMDLNRQIYEDTRGIQDRVYNQASASFAPYSALGGSAVGALGNLLNLPVTPTTGAPAMPTGAAAPQAPGQSAAEMAVARGAVGTTPNARAREQTASGYTLGRGVGAVALLAPDGSTRTVPASQAGYYIARGARPLDPGDAPATAQEVR